MNELELKKTLVDLRSGQSFKFPETVSDLIPVMLEYIGSPDAELRDELIYSAFTDWIYTQRLIPSERLRFILHNVLDDRHMFYHIGETEEDGVFTRSFSVLLLPLLLIVHRDQPYLSPDEVKEIRTKLLQFLFLEKDKRGFVEGKGWAHVVAHTADALDDLSLCDEIGKQDLIEILVGIRPVVCDPDIVYAYGEEERLCTAVLSILQRGLLSTEEVNGWIQSFSELVLGEVRIPRKIIIRTNVRNFLQSLYFRLLWKEQLDPHKVALESVLRTINPYVR